MKTKIDEQLDISPLYQTPSRTWTSRTLHLCLLAKMPPHSKEELATGGVAGLAAEAAAEQPSRSEEGPRGRWTTGPPWSMEASSEHELEDWRIRGGLSPILQAHHSN